MWRERSGAGRISVSEDAPVGGAVIALLLILFAPLPGVVLDTLLAANLGASLLLALVAARARSTRALRALPAALLLTTVARVAIEVAAVRAILSRGDPGALIPAVGRLALGGDWVVGVAVFAVLAGVQYVVVARGAERVAEVSARFALDALPGRQMSLDAAARAGLIDAATAERERARLVEESAFHAAMDGAMKFVRGDAVAGAIIAGVNLLGGAAVGALRDHLSPVDALQRYGALAVGQGLLAQVPSLLCALGAGLAVTRTGDEDIVRALRGTFLVERGTAAVSAACVAALGLLPGVPTSPFVVAASLLALLALRGDSEPQRAARIVLTVPGAALQDAIERTARLREHCARALGCDVPSVRVVEGATCSICLDGVPIGRVDRAEDAVGALRALLLHRPSRWFGVEEARAWLDALRESAPTLVGSTVPRRLTLSELAATLAELLDAGVPITQGRSVMERLCAAPRELATPRALAAFAREGLAASIAARWAPDGRVAVVDGSTLLAEAVVDAAARAPVSVPFVPGAALRRDLREAIDALGADTPRVIASSAKARWPLADALREVGSDRVVLSWEELGASEVERVGALGPQ